MAEPAEAAQRDGAGAGAGAGAGGDSGGEDDGGRALQNRVLLERFRMVTDFLAHKLGDGWTRGAALETPQQLLAVLKDGHVLCQLLGCPAQQGQPLANLETFRRACAKLDVPPKSIIPVSDLLKPTSLSCICVINCLQELRLKLLENDRALLNEHFCSPTKPGSAKSIRGSPRTLVGTPVRRKALEGSPLVNQSKGLLDLLPSQTADELLGGSAPATPGTPASRVGGGGVGSSGRSSRSRRISINTLNTQASLARVQERMASSYKERCVHLEVELRDHAESIDELQRTIAGLQRSKHEYQLDIEKLQDRNRLLLSNFRVMEAQIVNCVEAWKSCKPQMPPGEGGEFESHILALHETWDDIVEEKTVKKGLAGDPSTDNEEEEEDDGGASDGGTTVLDEEAEEEEAEKRRQQQQQKQQQQQQVGAAQVVGQSEDQLAERKRDIDVLCKQLSDLNVSTAVAAKDSARQPPSGELELAKDALRKTRDHISSLEAELEAERLARQRLQQVVTEKLSELRFKFGDLSNDCRGAISSSQQGFQVWAKDLRRRVLAQETAFKDLACRFKKETARRKQLLNTVHNLKGNIRVMCRIRPVLAGDLDKADPEVAVEAVSEDKLTVTTEAKSACGLETSKVAEFDFDRVFGPTSSQKNVFDEVQPLVESVMDGYHSCIFAYGQTGSGKTYTMSGDGSAENHGINFIALEELFRLHDQRRVAGTEYKFSVRNVEIYCEKVIDLLAPSKGGEPPYLDVRMNERDGVSMPGCVEVPVSTAEEVNGVMELGAKNRTSAHTKMNVESSRSHSVVMVAVHGHNPETGKTTNGQLVLVDLAGSERLSKSGVVGAQLKEAQSINKSLSCLGDVIAALESKAPHVPFRNSKLTTLLQDSLGKDNKALMILQVSPTTYNAGESLCSLNFAARVRKCELGRAKKKERIGESSKSRAQVKQAQERVEKLEQRVRKLTKSLEEAQERAVAELEAAEREAAKQTRKVQEKLDHVLRNDKMEIEALREKLSHRDKSDNGKVAALEAELHSAKMEVNNLRQQLRSSISSSGSSAFSPVLSRRSPLVSAAAASPPPPPAGDRREADPTASPLQERRASRDNVVQPPRISAFHKTPERPERKQVSWKNTPQIIALSARKPRGYSSDANEDGGEDGSGQAAEGDPGGAAAPRVRVKMTASAAAKATKAASRSMGGATRVLQTPARKAGGAARTAARRIPNNAAKRSSRPAWN